MNRFVPLLLIGVIVVAIGGPAKSDPVQDSDAPRTNLNPLMQMKLDKSKLILEGLTLEQFDKIGKNASSLKLLSMESGWNVIQTEEYAAQSRDFQRTCDVIAEAAEQKDISRATLGYVAMTVRCVECHAYMRKHHSVSKDQK